MIKMTLPIEPKPQLRPRRARYKGVYDPAVSRKFKNEIGTLAKAYMRNHHLEPFSEPLIVSFIFYRPVQKSLSKVEKKRRLEGVHPPDVKPDVSNYLKAAEDGLNGILWKDDALIVREFIEKRYSEKPRIEIKVREWTK